MNLPKDIENIIKWKYWDPKDIEEKENYKLALAVSVESFKNILLSSLGKITQYNIDVDDPRFQNVFLLYLEEINSLLKEGK